MNIVNILLYQIVNGNRLKKSQRIVYYVSESNQRAPPNLTWLLPLPNTLHINYEIGKTPNENPQT